MNIFNPRLDQIDTPPSVAIAEKVRELTHRGIPVAKLQTGEPAFDTPAYIIEGAYRAMKEGHTHYSSSRGIPELIEALICRYQNLYSRTFDKAQIQIQNGAIHSIFCVLTAILSHDDEVIIPEPYWPQYRYISNLAGAQVRSIDTSKNLGHLSIEQLNSAVTKKTKLLIINNPNNPSGLVYSRTEIEAFIKLALEKRFYILFDEVYSQITYGNDFCSALETSIFEQAKNQVLYINSFSKSFAMTGWRIGYSILPVELAKKTLIISQNSITNVTEIVQFGALTALNEFKHNQNIFKQFQNLYTTRFFELKDLLNAKNISHIPPQGAFYFFINAGQESTQFSLDLLDKERIAVVPGSAYGEGYKNFYRISFAVDEASYQTFLSWLKTQ